MKLPRLVAQSVDIRGIDNFPCGCKFSPDGLCVLTHTGEDAKLRLYNTVFSDLSDEKDTDEIAETAVHPWEAELLVSGGNAVRCYDWYPLMRSDDPGTCCFVATARSQPIHLYDAYSGSVRATYRAFNSLDELDSAMVVLFNPLGQSIAAAGFRGADQRSIHIFDTAVPGRQSTTLLLGKTRRSREGQKGLVSAMAYGPARQGQQHLLAVGTYAPGSIYVYDQRAGAQTSGTVLRDGHCVGGHASCSGRLASSKRKRFDSDCDTLQNITGGSGDIADDEPDVPDDGVASSSWLSSAKSKWYQSRVRGGVTQLQFAGGDHEFILYSASRRSGAILAWDLRMLTDQQGRASQYCNSYGMSSFATENDTNQRLDFDLNETGDTLFAAGKDECVRIYDSTSGSLEGSIDGLGDTANGVSYGHFPSGPGERQRFVAVATGSRHFLSENDFDEEMIQESTSEAIPGCLRLYSV